MCEIDKVHNKIFQTLHSANSRVCNGVVDNLYSLLALRESHLVHFPLNLLTAKHSC